MGYMHINNLYKDDRIFQFSECYALEKIHGTSAHISFKKAADGLFNIAFFSGGESHDKFVALFDEKMLLENFYVALARMPVDTTEVVVYGEAYGGKQQGMSETYGKDLKFIVFDVSINGKWTDVLSADAIAINLGLPFVDYVKIPTQLSQIDAERNKPSTQAKRNGIIDPKIREGVVLRPIEEAFDHRGSRIISKHKNDIFSETKTHREVDPDKLKVLADANKIADEWVTEMRLLHVLDKSGTELDIKNTPVIIRAMVEDVRREAAGEIVESKDAMRAISSATARLFKKYLTEKFTEAHHV
jgi:hypothetical protein